MRATPERLALADRVLQLRSEGLTHREVASRLGISRSYASALATDPDGEKEGDRRDSYGGVCARCGGPTKSDGTSRPSEYCADCSHLLAHEAKVWTEATVIDAIKRFAVVHGRAPTSTEWIKGDPDNGYPPRASVYKGNPQAPFPQWADAIEAAGFPRPTTGRRTFREVGMTDRNGYVILREDNDGSWSIVEERSEPTQLQALNAALNGHEPVGRWLAVPVRYWRPRALRPKTIYDFVEEPAEPLDGLNAPPAYSERGVKVDRHKGRRTS